MTGKTFNCCYGGCEYDNKNYERFLAHVWDKHGFEPGFFYQCRINSCPQRYTSLRSYKKHVRTKHSLFHEKHMNNRRKKEHTGEGEETEIDDFLSESNVEDNNYEIANENDENEPIDSDFDVDYENIVACILLELRENFKATTIATCFLSEKLSMLFERQKKSISKFVLSRLLKNPTTSEDLETEAYLNSPSAFATAFQKFTGEKTLSEYVKRQTHYVEPVEVLIGDTSDTSQYVPIMSTLKVILEHEDVLGEINRSAVKKTEEGRIESFNDGTAFKNNELFKNKVNALQIVL